MPNWTENKVIFRSAEAMSAFWDKYIDSGKGELFNKILPAPYTFISKYDPDTKKKEQFCVAKKGVDVDSKYVEKNGRFDWYNWNCDNWGTKWDKEVSDVYQDSDEVITFSTAWSPPYPILIKLAKEFGGLKVMYDDEGLCYPTTGLDINADGEYNEYELSTEFHINDLDQYGIGGAEEVAEWRLGSDASKKDIEKLKKVAEKDHAKMEKFLEDDAWCFSLNAPETYDDINDRIKRQIKRQRMK